MYLATTFLGLKQNKHRHCSKTYYEQVENLNWYILVDICMYPYNTKTLLHILLIAVMGVFNLVTKNFNIFYTNPIIVTNSINWYSIMVVYLDGLCIQVKMFGQKVQQFFTYIYFGVIKLLFVHPERKFRINTCNDIITDNALLKIIKFLVPVYELHDIYVVDYILKKKVMKTRA